MAENFLGLTNIWQSMIPEQDVREKEFLPGIMLKNQNSEDKRKILKQLCRKWGDLKSWSKWLSADVEVRREEAAVRDM